MPKFQEMLKPIIFVTFLLFLSTFARPVLDENLIGPHYKKLTENVESKLKFVQEIGNEKPKPNEMEDELVSTPDPMPTIQLLTTPLIDSKLDDEIEEESSNSEEENEHSTAETSNATSPSTLHENSQNQRLSVEEHEAVFDDKQEILAKKPMPQIMRTANTLPTILPQTATAPKPTPSENPTTPIPPESHKNAESQLSDLKQKASSTKLDKLKSSDTSIQVPKHQTDQKHSELSIDNQQQMHDNEIMDDRIAGDRQDFDSKTDENNQQRGSIVYGQSQLIPEIAPTLLPPMTTPISNLIVTEVTAKKPTNIIDQDSIWTKIIKGVRCSHGDCEGVLVSTTPSGPRELKPSKIIRRARRQDENIVVVCRCLTG